MTIVTGTYPHGKSGMSETRVWLVRHAETATPHLFHGAESDVGLSERGERQAKAIADWFRPLTPTVVISSAMQRAVRSAAPISHACGIPHRTEPDLHERRVGGLSGSTFSASEGPWAETIRFWQHGQTGYSTPGAESFDDIRSRVIPAWERITAAQRGGRIVVVAHGVVCKVLLLSLLPGLTAADWTRLGKVQNMAVSELVLRGKGPWAAAGLLVVPDPVRDETGGPAGSAA